MNAIVKSCLTDLSHLLFPHHCEGCGSDSLNEKEILCARCVDGLPATGFFEATNNPVEKIFYGRTRINNAAAAYYFTKDSLLQHLMIRLKYRNDKNAGLYLGKLMGYILQQAERFTTVDSLIPLPLNEKKEQSRGYNQAALICDGISSVWQKPVFPHAMVRSRFTETQTKQGRVSRWQNMEGVFSINPDPAAGLNLENRHILLVDDVITTGATLEACASAILEAGASVSIATVAFTI